MKFEIKLGQVNLGKAEVKDIAVSGECKVSDVLEKAPSFLKDLYNTYKEIQEDEEATKEESNQDIPLSRVWLNDTSIDTKEEKVSIEELPLDVVEAKPDEEEGFKFTEEEIKHNRNFYIKTKNTNVSYERFSYDTVEKIYNNQENFVEGFKYRCLDNGWDFKFIYESIIESVDEFRLRCRGEHVLKHVSLIDYIMPIIENKKPEEKDKACCWVDEEEDIPMF